MGQHMIGYRVTAAVTAVSLFAASVPIHPAAAQAAGDPPARVGRLSSITGTVSYHLGGADRWEAATLNLPVTTGTAIWTEPGARAGIGVSGNRVVLDSSTEVDVAVLDDRTLTTTQPQGATYLHLAYVPAGTGTTVQTPRGIVAIAAVGRYEVVAGDTMHPTLVTVLEGAAQISGGPAPVQVGANQTATITGDGTAVPFTATVGPAVHDAFLDAMLQAERPPAPRGGVAAPAYVAQMTGGEELSAYGEWAANPEYGTVWYPQADAGYVPYRDGHWAYVQPWGWTWVDNAAWGFAPSHYGRWVEIGDRWGWTPGAPPAPGYLPVYAPAVVSFIAGAALGAALGGAFRDRGGPGGGPGGGPVGWVPLGPREPYYPPYRVSNTYVRNVNVTNVTNISSVVNTYNAGGVRPGGALLNVRGATAVPAAAMAASANVAQAARPVPPGVLQQRGAVLVRPPVTPALATAGVTPAVARQFNLPPQGAAARPAAPGPAFTGNQFRPGGALPLRAATGAPAIGPAPAGPGAPLAEPGRPGPGSGPGPGVVGGAAAGLAGGAAGAALLRPGGLPGLRPVAPAGQGPAGPVRPNGGAPGPAIARPEPGPGAAPGGPGLPGRPEPGGPGAERLQQPGGPRPPAGIEAPRPGPAAVPGPTPGAPGPATPIPERAGPGRMGPGAPRGPEPGFRAPQAPQPMRPIAPAAPPPAVPHVQAPPAPRPVAPPAVHAAPPPPMVRAAPPPQPRPAPPPPQARPQPQPQAHPAPAPHPQPAPQRPAPAHNGREPAHP